MVGGGEKREGVGRRRGGEKKKMGGGEVVWSVVGSGSDGVGEILAPKGWRKGKRGDKRVMEGWETGSRVKKGKDAR